MASYSTIGRTVLAGELSGTSAVSNVPIAFQSCLHHMHVSLLLHRDVQYSVASSTVVLAQTVRNALHDIVEGRKPAKTDTRHTPNDQQKSPSTTKSERPYRFFIFSSRMNKLCSKTKFINSDIRRHNTLIICL